MRCAIKQRSPASTLCVIDTKRGRILVQRSRYLQETYIKKTGKRPLQPVSTATILMAPDKEELIFE